MVLREKKRGRGRPRNDLSEIPQGNVQSLERAILLLQVLAKSGQSILSDLALRAGIPASTAHRLLRTLETHKLVEFNEHEQVWLVGVETFRIGSAFAQRGNLVDIARDVMQQLVQETGETANLAIADDGEIVVISQIDTQNPIRAYFPTGTRVPMHSSGIGKALLAEFDKCDVEFILKRRGLKSFTERTLTASDILFANLELTRNRGWSLDDEERYLGMRCIAAPIFNAYGEAVAGISVSGPTGRFDDIAIPEMAAKVRRAAAQVTELSGGTNPHHKSN